MIKVTIYLKSYSQAEMEQGSIPAITREYVCVPNKDDDITLFDGCSMDTVHRREFNRDGSVSLIVKIREGEHKVYKSLAEEEPT